ncbi:MAG: helix-turn-helix domain-containing protein [Ruminococcus flavefaciens]|nr:helix-turn-helix domain-containing protein [Ruminococcus flavefaciens]
MTKTQMVEINKIANSIKDMEVTPTDEKIYEIVYILTQERKNQKLSQDDLAAKSGLTKNTISRIETFSSTPTLPALIQISHALALDIVITKK